MARPVRSHRLSTLCALALGGLLSACGTEQPLQFAAERSAALSGAAATAMTVYSPRGQPMDEAGFVWLGPAEGLGGRVLEGEPKIFARLDYLKGPTAAGLFKATTGRIEVTFPFTEHATILQGQVTITDSTGQSHLYKPGDSYFVRQGQVIIWDVKDKQVIKSFFNVVEAP